MQETQVWFLDWEGSLEKEMATHSSILAQRIPWTEESGGPQSMGSQTVWHDWVTNIFTLFFAYLYVTLVLTGYNPQMQRSVSCSNKWFWSLEKKKNLIPNEWGCSLAWLYSLSYCANDINKLILRVYFVAPKSSFLSRASVLIKFSHHYKYIISEDCWVGNNRANYGEQVKILKIHVNKSSYGVWNSCICLD